MGKSQEGGSWRRDWFEPVRQCSALSKDYPDTKCTGRTTEHRSAFAGPENRPRIHVSVFSRAAGEKSERIPCEWKESPKTVIREIGADCPLSQGLRPELLAQRHREHLSGGNLAPETAMSNAGDPDPANAESSHSGRARAPHAPPHPFRNRPSAPTKPRPEYHRQPATS